jgi:hypothetical protein
MRLAHFLKKLLEVVTSPSPATTRSAPSSGTPRSLASSLRERTLTSQRVYAFRISSDPIEAKGCFASVTRRQTSARVCVDPP